jgi:hypothetical protein
MYVCMYVCMYVYMYVYIYIYRLVIHVYKNVYIFLSMYACTSDILGYIKVLVWVHFRKSLDLHHESQGGPQTGKKQHPQTEKKTSIAWAEPQQHPQTEKKEENQHSLGRTTRLRGIHGQEQRPQTRPLGRKK